ncbi:hypothetical protein F5Y09DRAFT_242350 [Xylaria sp. FL1042]|nr:hypothetical protein F5Y09DRAFT_242350 [Xylaria sp. FL1042]
MTNCTEPSLLRRALVRNRQPRPARVDATSGAGNVAPSRAEEADAERDLRRTLQRRYKHYVSLEEFVADSENVHDTRMNIRRFCKQFQNFTAIHKGDWDCSNLYLASSVKPGTQKWKLTRPPLLHPSHKREENLRHRPRDYFEALQSFIDVSDMQETGQLHERQQELIADFLEGCGHCNLASKGPAWCAKISPVIPRLMSVLAAIEYRDIKPKETRKNRVENHFTLFFGSCLSLDDILSHPDIRKENGEINADVVFGCVREKRCEQLKSHQIQGSIEKYELCEATQVTALIVVWAMVHYGDRRLWPAWKEIGKAMVARFPSKTRLETSAFVHM